MNKKSKIACVLLFLLISLGALIADSDIGNGNWLSAPATATPGLLACAVNTDPECNASISWTLGPLAGGCDFVPPGGTCCFQIPNSTDFLGLDITWSGRLLPPCAPSPATKTTRIAATDDQQGEGDN